MASIAHAMHKALLASSPCRRCAGICQGFLHIDKIGDQNGVSFWKVLYLSLNSATIRRSSDKAITTI